MVWHLKIGQKLRVLGAKTWGVMFFQNFWLKLKGAILGPQNHFWWFQRQNGGFPNGYFGFLKKKLKSESAILRLPNFCSYISYHSSMDTMFVWFLTKVTNKGAELLIWFYDFSSDPMYFLCPRLLAPKTKKQSSAPCFVPFFVREPIRNMRFNSK